MKLMDIFRYLWRDHKLQNPQGSGKYRIVNGNEENLMKYGEVLLEERISLFNGRTNSIRCFSVDDINSMLVDKDQIIGRSTHSFNTLRGVWDGKLVHVKGIGNNIGKSFNYNYIYYNVLGCREIAVATEMGTHRNVHRLLGYCLHTMRISIPAGKKHVEDDIRGTIGYLPPDYFRSGKVVYFFLYSSQDNPPCTFGQSKFSNNDMIILEKWVSECRALNCLGDVVDPTITGNGAVADEVHLKAIVDIALSCAATDEECRPTMVDIATQLNDLIILSSDSL